MNRLLSEIKSAFPFLWYDRHKKPPTLAQMMAAQMLALFLKQMERDLQPGYFSKYKSMPLIEGEYIKFRRYPPPEV